MKFYSFLCLQRGVLVPELQYEAQQTQVCQFQSPNLKNFLDTNDIFKLLKVYNFDAPLINNNNFTIEYSVFKKLLDDVRFLNLPYVGKDKKNNFLFV